MPPLTPKPLSPELRFSGLKEHLLHAGIAPRHVRRYLAELSDHLTDLTVKEQSRGLPPTAAGIAALQRLGTTEALAEAMISQPSLRSLPARAPLAVFSFTPLALLACLWLLSLCLLRLGWHLFLPGANTPFGPAHPPLHPLDPQNIYFQLNRALYLAAPLLAGWCTLLLAARQRLNTLWPLLSLALLTLLAATSHVQANRLAIPTGLGHIRIDFALRTAPQNEYALAVLLLALAPYLFWYFQTHRTLTPKP